LQALTVVSNQDWHSFAKKIEETGVDALELNIIFCHLTGEEAAKTMRRFIMI